MFLGPQGCFAWPRFYIQTDPLWQLGSVYWYINRTVGKNLLSKYIKNVMEVGGIESYFCNHSTRKSIFQKNMDPQLIKHPEESSENTCDFGEIRKYILLFTMVVCGKTDFEA